MAKESYSKSRKRPNRLRRGRRNDRGLSPSFVVFFFTLFALVTYQNCSFSPEEQKIPSLGLVTYSCNFNGQSLSVGQSVAAYQNSTVPAGQNCVSEIRVCQNTGGLSGSYAYASCTPGAPAACLFNGQTIQNGGSTVAYLNSSVPAGMNCVSENRVCTNGSLSGSYTYASCSPGAPASCLFNGQTVFNNASVIAYLHSSVPYGQTCPLEYRTCFNGNLMGSYTFGSCTVGAPASCSFNSQTIANGSFVTAYQTSTVPSGQTCQSQIRTCTNGALSGSYTFGSCTVAAAASCLFNGQTVASGSSVTAYQNSTVMAGQSCVRETRTCTNGNLSGSFQNGSCSCSGVGLKLINDTCTIKASFDFNSTPTDCRWYGVTYLDQNYYSSGPTFCSAGNAKLEWQGINSSGYYQVNWSFEPNSLCTIRVLPPSGFGSFETLATVTTGNCP